ncbi:MAG: nuclear transport factor 2 family protein, partial [Elusimicrobiota bacterium]
MKTPEELVQAQVDAYNARDLEAFLATYAEEVVLVNDGKERTLAKAALRTGYGKLFSENPGLRCVVLRRESTGNTVIDDERVDGLADGSRREARATYELENGLI